jgi:hypothetical protein
MDQPVQDLRELLHMAALLKGAAGRAPFRDCSAIFLGVAELLERQAVMMAGGGSSTPPLAPPRHPINIMT